ncbi:hypothetical protein [Streptomyces sp. 8K308]|nr:hypothetical protein [Streptomyces sp. 8K308]
MGRIREFDAVVTDDGLSPAACEALRLEGVELLLTAPADEAE